MLKLKENKGITLIALIITIIVMLILVGVTINVALNGGLFEKAESATKETEKKAILEEMLAMMEITENGKIDYGSIIEKMKQKYTVQYSYPNATITGKLGIYNYIVSETEIKIKDKDDNLEALKKEIEGKLAEEVVNENGFINTEIQLVSSEGNTGIVSFRGEQFIIILEESGDTIIISSVERYNTPGNDTPGTGDVDDKLAKYLLGQNLQGRNIQDISDIASGYAFKDDSVTTDIDETEWGVETLCMIDSESGITGESDWYLKYNNKAYKVVVELDMTEYALKTKKGTLIVAYEPERAEGQTYTFNGEEWTILYDEGSYKEIVSPTVMGDIKFAEGCGEVDWTSETVIRETELDVVEGLSMGEKTVYSYNHAIELINKHCKNQINDSLASDANVRSVGGTSETSGMFTSPNWNSIYNGKGKSGDTLYKEDCIRMLFHGVFASDRDYWIASRHVDERSNYADFCLWYSDSSILSQWRIWHDEESGNGNAYSLDSFGVRPIVKITE